MDVLTSLDCFADWQQNFLLWKAISKFQKRAQSSTVFHFPFFLFLFFVHLCAIKNLLKGYLYGKPFPFHNHQAHRPMCIAEIATRIRNSNDEEIKTIFMRRKKRRSESTKLSWSGYSKIQRLQSEHEVMCKQLTIILPTLTCRSHRVKGLHEKGTFRAVGAWNQIGMAYLGWKIGQVLDFYEF